MKLSSRTKGRLRKVAKYYAIRSGKDWIDELSVLYRNEAAHRQQRKVKK